MTRGGILYHLDALLLMLSGAIDATALVAADAHGIGLPVWEVGWRRKRWRTALAGAAPHLHAQTEPGTPVRALIDLVAEIRNTIHGEPLRGVHYQGSGEQMHLVTIPEKSAAKFVGNCEDLGGSSHWGIRRQASPFTLLDPLRFVQVLLPIAAAALSELMAATEVERLPGVDVRKLMTSAPSTDVFEPHAMRRLQLLHGLAS